MKFIMMLILVLMIAVSGCVHATYNTETKEISYFRLGNQEFNGFEVVLPDGSYVTFEHQKSETQILAKIIERLLVK